MASVADFPMPTRRTMLATTLAASACRPRGADSVLRFWAMSYEGDYAPLFARDFTRDTGIVVDTQSLPWTAAHEKLLTAFAGDTLPDVLMLPSTWVEEFATIGAIAGSAVPWSTAPLMQFYRRDLVEQAGYAAPPGDWAAWRTMAERLSRRPGGGPAVLLYLNWWDALFSFAAQAGAVPLRDRDTRGDFASPAFREALAFYVSLFARGVAPRALSTQVADPLGAFAQGLFAVWPSAPYLLLDLRRRAAEIPADRWAMARLPGPHGPGVVSAIGTCLTVSARARRPRAARAFVRYLTSVAAERQLHDLIGSVPARPEARAGLAAPLAAQAALVARDPPVIEWERIRIEVQLIAERVVRGQMTIDAGLRAMDARADRLLARRRALVEAGRIA